MRRLRHRFGRSTRSERATLAADEARFATLAARDMDRSMLGPVARKEAHRKASDAHRAAAFLLENAGKKREAEKHDRQAIIHDIKAQGR